MNIPYNDHFLASSVTSMYNLRFLIITTVDVLYFCCPGEITRQSTWKAEISIVGLTCI